MRYILKKYLVLLFFSISFLSAQDLDSIIKDHYLYKQKKIQSEYLIQTIETISIKKLPLKGNLTTKFYGSIFQPSFYYSIGGDITYNLFDDSSKKEIALKGQDILLSNLKLNNVYELINYNITKCAINYLSSKNILDIVNKSYDSISNYTIKVNDLFNSGNLSRSEKLYSDSVLLKNKATLIDAEYSVEKAYIELKNEIGIDLNDKIISEIIEQLSHFDSEYQKNDNINLKILDYEYNKALMSKNFSNENSTVKLNLSGGIKFPFDTSTSWQIGLNVTIPFFGVKLDNSIKKEFDYKLEELDIQKIILQDKVNTQIDEILIKKNNINKKIEIYNEALILLISSMDGILTESIAGERTVFDVISSKNSISDIERYITEALNELLYLDLEYTYLTGGLL